MTFPGYGGEGSLERISWDRWFGKFDRKKLALILQDETSGGEKSRLQQARRAHDRGRACAAATRHATARRPAPSTRRRPTPRAPQRGAPAQAARSGSSNHSLYAAVVISDTWGRGCPAACAARQSARRTRSPSRNRCRAGSARDRNRKRRCSCGRPARSCVTRYGPSAVREEHRNSDVRVALARIEQACGLVAHQLLAVAGRPGRDCNPPRLPSGSCRNATSWCGSVQNRGPARRRTP